MWLRGVVRGTVESLTIPGAQQPGLFPAEVLDPPISPLVVGMCDGGG